jgi:thiol-disulfide isomerase/thioredoxin
LPSRLHRALERAGRGWSGALLVALACQGQVAHADEVLKRWPGGPTPALKLKHLDGRPADLRDYRGKVVLVNFWATWCEPCRDELPSIERLRDRFARGGFEVMAVNVGEGEARVASFLKDSMIDVPVVMDSDSAALKDWKVRGLPMTFLIDPEGRIRYSLLGKYDWSGKAAADAVQSMLPSAK